MDHNTTTNPEEDLVWLTDSEGNNYLMRREAVAHHSVPKEISSQVKDFVEADTHGYGSSEWALKGVSTFWGMKTTDKGVDASFDFNQDGMIDGLDWDIAMKAWYEEHPKDPSNF
jgi:hypothetical protein